MEDIVTIRRPIFIAKVKPFIDKPIVKVFTGIRRCGKSVMMHLVQSELKDNGIDESRILSLNFESRNDKRTANQQSVCDVVAETAKRFSGQKIYLFFDEVQELIGWEKIINSFLVDYDCDIYITGSNAHLLSGELATYLGGRYVSINIYPFSFQELVSLQMAQGKTVDKKALFREYLTYGGFPCLYNYNFSDSEKNQYLSDVFDSIIIKDIAQRNAVRDVALFKQVVTFIMSNVGNTFSAKSIVNYLKSINRTISTETLYNYIDYAKNAFLLMMIQRQDLVGKVVLSSQEKIYLTDHGMRQALYGFNTRDIGQILENIVCLELRRRGYDVTVGKNVENEVDFCCANGNDISYYQVAYLLASPETTEREFGAFRRIKDNYPRYVLSLDEFDFSQNGIIHKNIIDWLLEYSPEG